MKKGKSRTRLASEAILMVLGEDLVTITGLVSKVERVVRAIVEEADREAVNRFALEHDRSRLLSHRHGCPCTVIHAHAVELRRRKKEQR